MRLTLIAAVLAVIAFPAAAQEVTGSVIDFSPFLEPILITLGGIIATAAVWVARWAGSLLKARVGIEIEEKHYQNLHRALANAAAEQAAKLTPYASVDVHSEAVANMVRYVMRKDPDAVAFFKQTVDDVAELAVKKLGALLPFAHQRPEAPPEPETQPQPVPVAP